MKIRKVEVRATYNIEYTLKDFWEIIGGALNDVTNVEKCFHKYNGEKSTLGDVRNLFESFNGFNGDELSYIARKLGFDGWENAGSFDETRDVRTFTVYRYGDTLQ